MVLRAMSDAVSCYTHIPTERRLSLLLRVHRYSAGQDSPQVTQESRGKLTRLEMESHLVYYGSHCNGS